MRKLLIIGMYLAYAGMFYAQTGLDKTATQIASEMMPGWNLGNTMEAAVTWGSNPAGLYNNNGGLASETAWQGTANGRRLLARRHACEYQCVGAKKHNPRREEDARRALQSAQLPTQSQQAGPRLLR